MQNFLIVRLVEQKWAVTKQNKTRIFFERKIDVRDFQCILCKYKNNEDKCMEAIEKYDFECPSLSNIFYGKIIKIPVIKQIYQVWDKIHDNYSHLDNH